MPSLRRTLALVACGAALSCAAGPASASARSQHQQRQTLMVAAAPSDADVANAALDRLLAGLPYEGVRLDVAHVVTATVCYHGACATKRLQVQPACDPSAGACVGTALRAWRPDRATTIKAELL